MTNLNFHQIQELIESILRQAGAFFTEPTERYFSFKTFNRADVKEVSYLGSTVITTLDVLVQDFIQVKLLDAGYSNFGMIAEEDDTSLTKFFSRYGRYKWVLDPVDGTLNFLSGNKRFLQYVYDQFGKENFESYYQLRPKFSSVILGLKEQGENLQENFMVSGTYFPFTDTFYTAVRGEGSYKNGVRFSQPKCSNSGLIKTNSQIYRQLRGKNNRVVKAAGAGCTLVQLAEEGGFTFLVKDSGIYDVGPVSLIVEEAGGTIDNFGYPFFLGEKKLEYFLAGSSPEQNRETVQFVESLGFHLSHRIKEGWSR